MGGLHVARGWCDTPVAVGAVVPDFALPDPNDRWFKLSEHADSVLVLIVTDREGSRYSSTWGRAARLAADSARAADSAGVGVRIWPVADLRGVPGFLRGYVKGKFKPASQPVREVLLDWKGVMAQIFALEPNVANAFVLDPTLRLQYAAHAVGSPEELAQFRAAIRAVIDTASRARKP